MTEKEKEIKKLQKEKIKKYKQQLHSEIFALDNELNFNENGDALIECKIGKAENIFNKYDLAKERTVTDEFEKYLLDEVEIIPMIENVAIKIYVDDSFTEENEKQVRKAIKNHFSFNITKDKVKMKSNNLWAIMFYILGALCLISLPFLNRYMANSFIPLYETMLVLTWFFLWEGFGMMFFDGSDLKTHRYNMIRLYNADISFARIQPPNISALSKPAVVAPQEEKINKVIKKQNKENKFLSLFSKLKKK